MFFRVGEKVTVSCKPGFETKQDTNLTCQNDGNWDKNFPQCTGKFSLFLADSKDGEKRR